MKSGKYIDKATGQQLGYIRRNVDVLDTTLEVIERAKQRTGNHPERMLSYKIYRNHDNLKYFIEWNIRLSANLSV